MIRVGSAGGGVGRGAGCLGVVRAADKDAMHGDTGGHAAAGQVGQATANDDAQVNATAGQAATDDVGCAHGRGGGCTRTRRGRGTKRRSRPCYGE